MEDFIRLNTELQQLQTQIAEKKWAGKRLSEIHLNIKIQEEKVTALQTQLQKEQRDVRNLEELSLTGVFYAILGSKEQQLDKERQEALRAQLQYDEAQSSLELLQSDLVHLQNQVKDLEDITQIFETKLETKLSSLISAGHLEAQNIREQHLQIQQFYYQQHEIAEAIEAAKQYQNVLVTLIKQLDSSKNWGTWDLLGGGVIASYAKQRRLSNARQTASSLRYYGQKLEKELADLKQTYHLEVNMSAIEQFVDIFFDNLLVDWMIQQRISQSLGSAKLVRSQLHHLIMDLSRKYSYLTQQIAIEEEQIVAKIIKTA